MAGFLAGPRTKGALDTFPCRCAQSPEEGERQSLLSTATTLMTASPPQVKPKKGTGPAEEKRALGFVLLRGESLRAMWPAIVCFCFWVFLN